MAFTAGRIVDVYWDVGSLLFWTSAGRQAEDLPYVSWQEQVLLRIRYVNTSISIPYPITGAVTWLANADNLFNDSTALAFSSDNTQINVAGDWVGNGNADPAQGQVSVR